MTNEIPKKYKNAAAEEKWSTLWEEWGIHRWDASKSRDETFVVDTPPPTVSGSLHVGHVFSYTHQDLIVRYQRMKGKNISYPMGWDDNGLPTERRVQNMFGIQCEPRQAYDADWQPDRNKGKKDPVEEISRRNFIEACGIVTEEDEKVFEELWRRLGLSIDWSNQYATIDEHCRRISQRSFLDLVEKGHVYNTESPTMWDVDFKTAVAQAEVEDREKGGVMHDIRFALADGGEFTIATTRPELLAACIAVVAHPDDPRYQDHFGKKAITPLFGAEVPIMAASHADPEKGTGILMVCTFGDANDVDWWKTQDLPVKQVIGLDGKMLPVTFGEGAFTDSADDAKAQAAYDEIAGLWTKQAKKKIAEMLAEDGTGPAGDGAALVGEPEQIMHPVKFYEKGDRPLEFVPTRQWFIRILDKKEELLAQGAKIQWHPSFMRTRFDNWVEGLNQDWCISRQRYFGVPFPTWYPVREDGIVVVVANRLLGRLRRDPATARQRLQMIWACIAVVALLTLPKTLSRHREERLATRLAAEWLAEQASFGGPVAAEKERTAWYAGEAFISLPAPEAKLPAVQLQKRGARFLIVDEEQLARLERLKAAIPTELRELQRTEAAGRTAFVYEFVGAAGKRAK